jgi:O-antigen/teichoic acid export membrane protein
MELGKHLGKGLWGIADKALPVVYGLAFVLLVIRVLPERDFGNFVLVQEVFLVISALIAAFALQPMTKFLAEEGSTEPEVVGAGLWLSAGITAVASITVLLIADPLSVLLNAQGLAPLMRTVPLMLIASFPRNFTLAILQARFRIKELFWVDAAHFLGAPLLVWVFSRMGRFETALDLILVTIVSLSLSSAIGLWYTGSGLSSAFRARGDQLRRMWHYGSYVFGGTVSYLIYSRADTFILSAVTGPLQVAVYSSAKIFTRVFDMVTQIVQMFVLPAASRLASQGDRHSLKAVVEKVILFLTVALLPVLAIFLLLPEVLLQVLYGGRYLEAAPLLRVFALLTGAVPLLAVAMNLLLGLGKARESFFLGIQMLVMSTLCYFVFIPWMAAFGAAVAVVVSTYLLALFSARQIYLHTGTSVGEVLARSADIVAFLRSRLQPTSREG